MKKPGWVKSNVRALNGGVLVTGSIGSGKTQAALLPILEGVLRSFTPVPSALIIDPKGDLKKEVIEMAEKLGRNGDVIHIKLGGNVTLNPIYQKDILKNARHINVAQLLKASMMNLMAGSSDPIWHESAANLITNCLVHCAVKKGKNSYFTLNDLYQRIVDANEAGVVPKSLKKVLDLESKDYDHEERCNIEHAIRFFEKDYSKLEDRVKSSIAFSCTTFFNQLENYQASRIFCPTDKELVVTSMDELVDSGKIILFDIRGGLAKSMGAVVKLLYQDSVLRRLEEERDIKRSAILLIDEYQDIVTVSAGSIMGDDKCLAKGRAANIVTIAATQSYSSLLAALRHRDVAFEIIQNFRTKIACHSDDLKTATFFRELSGDKIIERKSHSISEMTQKAQRNLLLGDFDGASSNISESVSHTETKEKNITPEMFASLNTFEAFARVYDGVGTTFKKLYLKPYFLKNKRTPHREVLKMLKSSAVIFGLLLSGAFPQKSQALPNICAVVNTHTFESCTDLKFKACVCKGIPPRPCARISYYVPQTFIEVMPNAGETHFKSLPGITAQLKTIKKKSFGMRHDDSTHSYHAHTLNVPFATMVYDLLSCGGSRQDKYCFDAMSEHTGKHWYTGHGDLAQPRFFAWSLAPKACLLKGAASSLSGVLPGMPKLLNHRTGHEGVLPHSLSGPSLDSSLAGGMCSVPLPFTKYFPPSSHKMCTAWGLFFPRSGTYHGASSLTAALMVGARLRSLATEVFRSTPTDSDEKWQQISPQSSSCFREGDNIASLENLKNTRELGRLAGGWIKGHLFTIWKRVSCCKDLSDIAQMKINLKLIKSACKSLGGDA